MYNEELLSSFPRPRRSSGSRKTGVDRVLQALKPVHLHVAADRTLESLDYDVNDSKIHQEDVRQRSDLRNMRRAFGRWSITFCVGILTALTAVFITYGNRVLETWRFNLAKASLGGSSPWPALFPYWGLAVLYTTCSALLISYICPVAAGSGIPEIKCVLNGLKVPGAVRLQTLACKVLGVIGAVAGGLPVGKEGPMIHSGAVVGAGFSQGKSTTIGCDTSFARFQDFRNDHEKRDFVSAGAAAGVAAAFGAPVGGVLFSLEEGSSFWSVALTWRSFFCAMMSTFTLDMFLSGISKSTSWGRLSKPGMFTFGDFDTTLQSVHGYSAAELPIFMLMGAVGGLLGAGLNGLNTALTRWRQRSVSKWPPRKVAEVVVITSVVAVASFAGPVLFSHCLPVPETQAGVRPMPAEEMVQFRCPDGQFDETASVFFSPLETAIKFLFHAPMKLSILPLLIHASVYFFLVTWSYGASVSSGMFIPCILVGSSLGRAFGEYIHTITDLNIADAGTYALIGAAAVLGGVVRMTISLAVILLESTADLQFGLPIMLTLMTARWVGNVFNEGLYDIHVRLAGRPFLEEGTPRETEFLYAVDIMSRPAVVLRQVERVGVILDTLKHYSHSGFPIIHTPDFGPGRGRAESPTAVMAAAVGSGPEPPELWSDGSSAEGKSDTEASSTGSSPTPGGRTPDPSKGAAPVGRQRAVTHLYQESPLLAGLALRKHLCILLKHPECFRNRRPKPFSEPADIEWAALEAFYPRYATVDEITLTEEQRNCWIDLGPYYNATPFAVQERMSASRVYGLFRTMGLRHLCVVDRFNGVTGMITRKDLTDEHLHERLDALSPPAAPPPQPTGKRRRRSTIPAPRRSLAGTGRNSVVRMPSHALGEMVDGADQPDGDEYVALKV